MATKTKKQSKLAWIAVCATVIGLALYIISGLIFSSKSFIGWPAIVLSCGALLLLAVVAYAGETVPKLLRDICVIGGGLCLIGAISFFVLNRVEPAADIWFIPVNYPVAEATSLYLSCAGIAFYFVAFVAVVIKAFSAKD